jgi:dCTP deaminase
MTDAYFTSGERQPVANGTIDRSVTRSLPTGGWLSGEQIQRAVGAKGITIEPFSSELLNPNSYNYRLGPQVLRLITEEIDLLGAEEFEALDIGPGGLVLLPGECYLGHTCEVFGSNYFASLITGRSSVGRKFVTNHITAGLIDVGFCGQVTLEIVVQRPTRVYAGIPFGQIFWFSLFGPPTPQYVGKYQGQVGPVESRLAKGRDHE